MVGYLFVLAFFLIAFPSLLVSADQLSLEESVLTNRLNNLESQAVHRRSKGPVTLDLLNRQDNKLAGQILNRFKTESPGSTALPRLERKLDRSRRPFGRIGVR